MDTQFNAEIIETGPLTPAEGEVLRLVCEAYSDKDIARALDVSISTVQRHIEHIYIKLDVTHSRLNHRLLALRQALSRGLVRLVCLVLVVSASLPRDDMYRAPRGRLTRVEHTPSRGRYD